MSANHQVDIETAAEPLLTPAPEAPPTTTLRDSPLFTLLELVYYVLFGVFVVPCQVAALYWCLVACVLVYELIVEICWRNPAPRDESATGEGDVAAIHVAVPL